MTIKINKAYLPVKRFFDIVLSLIGLLILAIPMVIIALIIKLGDGGSVFFKQERVGRDHQVFNILKFRTMVEDAPEKGGQITIGQDKRITKVGGFLRKYKLDELPQLINVFVGHMSLVGPRPEVPKYVRLYDKTQSQVLLVRPGITDLASISYRSESDILAQAEDPERAYIEDIMPEKLRLNTEYINKMSLLYDLRLIFRTLKVVVAE